MKVSAKDWLRKLVAGVDEDPLRSGLAALARGLMELEVSELAGAERYERSDERGDVRNGDRSRRWDTRAGSIELRIPKLHGQGYQPSFLEPRRRSEAAMLAVVQEAYVLGVSTRKVEDLVRAMGVESDVRRARRARRCRRRLPERRVGAATDRHGPERTGRRVEGGPPRLRPRVHGAPANERATEARGSARSGKSGLISAKVLEGSRDGAWMKAVVIRSRRDPAVADPLPA
jgi:hypothetical protein